MEVTKAKRKYTPRKKKTEIVQEILPNDDESSSSKSEEFLTDMEAGNFVEPPPPEEDLSVRGIVERHKRKPTPVVIVRRKAPEPKVIPVNDERRGLRRKIAEYHRLFPERLKIVKHRKNLTNEELKNHIEELSCAVEASGYDVFVSDAILMAIKTMEGITENTNVDISGTADQLKTNPQFDTLSKQLYLKYGSFLQIPVELQMGILLITTMTIQIRKNKGKGKINDFLDSPIEEEN